MLVLMTGMAMSSVIVHICSQLTLSHFSPLPGCCCPAPSCSLHHSSASLSNLISHHLHNSLICFSLLASMSSNGKNQKHSSTSATSPCSYSDFLQRASNSWRPRKLAHSTPLHHTAAALHPDQNFTALAISSLATTFHSSPLTSLISSSR